MGRHLGDGSSTRLPVSSESAPRPAEGDVDQLGDGVFLAAVSVPQSRAASARPTAATTARRSSGLMRNPAPRRPRPGDARVDVWTSAVAITTTRARVHRPQLAEDFQPVHARHGQVEQDEVRLVEGVPLQGGQPVGRLGDRVPGVLQDAAGDPPRQGRVVHDQDLRHHSAPGSLRPFYRAGRSWSLSPASATDRGIPYTTHVSSASVNTRRPGP